MASNAHALLSASSSHRWLHCPPSARLCENYEETSSAFAAEGTDAHTLCEYRLKSFLGIACEDPIDNLTYFNAEMDECASGYASYVMELLSEAREKTTDPIVLIEQKLDFSKYVPDGFGTGDCIKTPRGKDNWSQTTVVSILTNEKYKGDALLQKSYTVDYLQKKVKKNEGEVPQYYVKDNHPAIIDKDDWDLVQAELARRRSLINSYTQNCIITTKLVCGNCGGSYGKKTWHSTDKYRTEILRCNNKYTNHTGCKTPHLTEEKVKQRFIPALNEMLSAYDSIKSSVSEQIRFISDCTALEQALADIEAEIDIQIRAIEDCVNQNARTAQDQEEYKRRYEILEEKYNRLVEKKNATAQKLSTRKARNIELQRFDDNLQSVPQFVTEWDDSLWMRLLEKAVVRLDGKIEFHFKNGMVVEN